MHTCIEARVDVLIKQSSLESLVSYLNVTVGLACAWAADMM